MKDEKLALFIGVVAATAVFLRWCKNTAVPDEKRAEATPSPQGGEEVEAPEKVSVTVVPPWRFNRPNIPRPDVVDPQRLAKLLAGDIQFALHRAYMGDLSLAERLHASLRGRAERAVFPLREDAVGALEDIYVLHPDRVMHD